MRAEAAMHRHAHVSIDTLAGEVPRHILDHARRNEAHALEAPAMRQHLIEGGHGPRRGETAAAGHTGATPGLGVLMRKAQLLTVVSWQAMALTAAALIAGIPLGILAGRCSWALFAASVGVYPGIKVPVLPIVAETGAALLLAIITALIPGRAAARVRPAAILWSE